MKYADYRDKIRSGDVLAWTHTSGWFTSWTSFKINFVRLWRRSEYSHVALAVVFGGRVWTLESTKPVVRCVPLSNFLPCYLLVGDGLTDTELERGMALVGIGEYSEVEAMMAGVGEDTPDTTGKWECAKFVNYVKQYGAQDTPDDLVDFMLSRGSTLIKLEP